MTNEEILNQLAEAQKTFKVADDNHKATCKIYKIKTRAVTLARNADPFDQKELTRAFKEQMEARHERSKTWNVLAFATPDLWTAEKLAKDISI